jgi:hypothetical protein
MTKRCPAVAGHDLSVANGLATQERQARNILKIKDFSLPRIFGNGFAKLLICQMFS